MDTLDLSLGTGLQRTDDHRYYWQDQGPFPGVTTVQKVLGGGEGLIRWAKNQVAAKAVGNIEWLAEEVYQGRADRAITYLVGEPDRVRDRAADLGSSVHHFAEQAALGRDFDAPTAVVPFIRQYLDWRRVWQPTYLAVEYMGVHLQHRYGGTGDLIVGCGGENWLLDIKSGKFYAEHALQLVACAEFEFIGRPYDATQYPVPRVDRFGILDLKPDGWRVVPYEFDRTAAFAAFTQLADLYHWKKTLKGVMRPAFGGRAEEEVA